MSASTTDNTKKKASLKTKSIEEVVEGFQRLRAEQRGLVVKINKVEIDVAEHRNVIKALTPLDPNRKCCRMMNGVLVHQTVGVVLPSLIENEDRLNRAVKSLEAQLVAKGQELNQYRTENNINIKLNEEDTSEKTVSTTEKAPPSVLVS